MPRLHRENHVSVVNEWACLDHKGIVHEVLVSVEGGQVTTHCFSHYFWSEAFGLVARAEYARQLVTKTNERVSCLFCLERR